LCVPTLGQSQQLNTSLPSLNENFITNTDTYNQALKFESDTTSRDASRDLPNPTSVLYKSMIIPGWGQIVNKQAWKVPIVYATLGGLGYYSVHLTKKYHDYRAAYYNLNPDTPDDLRFGSTPSYIPEGANLNEVRDLRNKFRNNRDLVYVGIVLAYGLNIVDAYVFAHMRSFDVSKDLSMRPRVKPAVMAQSNMPGITFSIDLITK
jgi:hypothetical protein